MNSVLHLFRLFLFSLFSAAHWLLLTSHSGVSLVVVVDWVQVWSEYIKAVFSCGADQRAILGMESEFLHIHLALMQEHHLGRDIHV